MPGEKTVAGVDVLALDRHSEALGDSLWCQIVGQDPGNHRGVAIVGVCSFQRRNTEFGSESMPLVGHTRPKVVRSLLMTALAAFW
jgi:hypothetical protein